MRLIKFTDISKYNKINIEIFVFMLITIIIYSSNFPVKNEFFGNYKK